MNALTKRVGIRDFRNTATQLIREVRETGSEIVITVDGEPVAVVRPFTSEDSAQERVQADKADMDAIRASRAAITALWPTGVSAADAVSEQRR